MNKSKQDILNRIKKESDTLGSIETGKAPIDQTQKIIKEEIQPGRDKDILQEDEEIQSIRDKNRWSKIEETQLFSNKTTTEPIVFESASSLSDLTVDVFSNKGVQSKKQTFKQKILAKYIKNKRIFRYRLMSVLLGSFLSAKELKSLVDPEILNKRITIEMGKQAKKILDRINQLTVIPKYSRPDQFDTAAWLTKYANSSSDTTKNMEK